jgi:hypothetical protein
MQTLIAPPVAAIAALLGADTDEVMSSCKDPP